MTKLVVKIPTEIEYIIGVDEVGRGPLAGPLVVCAACLPRTSKYNKTFLKDFADSKKLSHLKRLALFERAEEAFKAGKVNYSFSFVDSAYIDKYGISKSVRLAISRSLKKLDLPPERCFVLLDGLLKAPGKYIFQQTIIKGDDKVKVISCASVLAKVHRDRFMIEMDKKYPKYGFSKHKGYGTKEHFLMIKKHGMCEIHRRSFLKNL